MKILLTRYSSNDNSIRSVEIAPEKYSEKEIQNLIQKYNSDNKNDFKYDYIVINDKIEKVIEFLITDRKADKNRVLDAIYDLKESIYDLKSNMSTTLDYIEESLKNGSEESK